MDHLLLLCLQIDGTISATFGPPPYRQGTVKAQSENKGQYVVDGEGEIVWEKGKHLKAGFFLDFPVEQEHLKQFKLNVKSVLDLTKS